MNRNTVFFFRSERLISFPWLLGRVKSGAGAPTLGIDAADAIGADKVAPTTAPAANLRANALISLVIFVDHASQEYKNPQTTKKCTTCLIFFAC
jgi:hypothetical protein